jgi:hypothetical protein
MDKAQINSFIRSKDPYVATQPTDTEQIVYYA